MATLRGVGRLRYRLHCLNAGIRIAMIVTSIPALPGFSELLLLMMSFIPALWGVSVLRLMLEGDVALRQVLGPSGGQASGMCCSGAIANSRRVQLSFGTYPPHMCSHKAKVYGSLTQKAFTRRS